MEGNAISEALGEKKKNEDVLVVVRLSLKNAPCLREERMLNVVLGHHDPTDTLYQFISQSWLRII